MNIASTEGGCRDGGGGDNDNVGWQWEGSHQVRFGNLLSTGFKSDFTLLLGPDKLKIPVHKIILQAGSRVLDSNISKSAENQLVIDLVDPNIFKFALNYLYTGNAGVTIRDALPLLKLATDYEISELRDQCVALLKSDITDDNVFPLFQGAMEHAHGELIQSTLGYICRYGYRTLERKEFTDLRLECLVEIIQQDKLRAVDELAVFNAVYRWGEEECKRNGKDMNEVRQVLEKPLGYIRFPLMDSAGFAMNVATKKLLDTTELTSLLICFLVPPDKRNVLPQGRFVSTPRIYLKGDIIVARSILRGTAHRQSLNSLRETIMIRGDEYASLEGFAISKPNFEAYYGTQVYYYDAILANVTMKCDDNVILQTDNQSFAKDCNDNKLLQLKFGKPFKFLNNCGWVELTIVLSGNGGYDNQYRQSFPIDSANCSFVSNYGVFEANDENGILDMGVSIKRKDGDPMKMEEGFIEKLFIQI